ncbi:MAG: molybdopterin-dependent oxidoreductase [Deltaproteobacteria bacterium]|nr:molybdopterin-dependent oxidoreductase [Deltaproteobacteria bacterium]
MLPFIKQAREAGAKVVLLEPLGTQTANFCDAHYRLLPGRDAYLAVGMAKVLRREGLVDQEFLDRHAANVEAYLRLLDGYTLPQCAELSGVPVGTIEELARLYGGRHPAAIILGYGINNWRRGAETYRLIDALAALTGNIGVPGGGVSHGHGNNHLETLADPSAHAREFVRHTRTIPQPIIGRGILEASDPPIKVIVVSSANPITQSPNAPLVAKAFRSVDFVVVIDQFLTDTADYAHVFLPTTTFLEEEDVCNSSGHPFFGRVRPAIAPQGEARTDLEIVQGLADCLGFGPLMAGTPKEWLERLLAPVFARGVSREALDQGLAELPDFEDVPFADRRFPTPSGRFELITEFPPDAPTADGRLYLLSIHPKSWLNSQALPKDQQGLPVASLHPEDGRRFGVADGMRARLRSSVGELTVRVKLTEASNPGYVLLYQGGWIKRGHGTNLLTEDRMTDTGLQAAYYETRVDLMPEEATA